MEKFKLANLDYLIKDGYMPNIKIGEKNGEEKWWQCLTCGKISSMRQYSSRKTVERNIYTCIYCNTPFWSKPQIKFSMPMIQLNSKPQSGDSK